MNLFNLFFKKTSPTVTCSPAKPIADCQLETCTLCQLNCRGCYMRKMKYGTRGRGYLTHENFIRFLDLNPGIKKIELANSGEIFLNPDLVKILRTAYERNIVLEAATGVNFNSVTDEQIDAIVRYKLRILTIALDGASQESYSWYRRNGNFDTVISNIKKLNAKKEELNSIFPPLRWQYIIFPSNNSISEIRKAKKMASELGMETMFVKDWDGFIPKNKIEVEKETGLSYSDDKYSNTEKNPFVFCSLLWQKPQIDWDGKFVGCCSNVLNGDFGANMFEFPLDDFMKSDIVIKTKQMLMGGKKCKESPCAKCWMYKRLKRSGKFLEEKDMLEVPWK